MLELVPGNYKWSYNILACLSCGGQLGDIAHILDELNNADGNDDVWHSAWSGLAQSLERRAESARAMGSLPSASENHFLQSLYYTISEHFIPPADPRRMETYKKALAAFEKARVDWKHPVERVEVPYEGGCLPAYFVPAAPSDLPAPTVIFLCGLDTTKEMSFLRVRDAFRDRGLNLLVVDTPGIGEALRLGRFFTRYDYEVPVGAVIDYLQGRPEVDPERIGLLGSSLGGYYTARASAREARIKASVAWGVVYDYHEVWRLRQTQGGTIATASFQLMYVTGTDSMAAAMETVKDFQVKPIGAEIKNPFLIMHGAEDQQVPVGHAEKMFESIGAADKELLIFNGDNGGAAHCQFDNHLPALQIAGDWLKKKLG